MVLRRRGCFEFRHPGVIAPSFERLFISTTRVATQQQTLNVFVRGLDLAIPMIETLLLRQAELSRQLRQCEVGTVT